MLIKSIDRFDILKSTVKTYAEKLIPIIIKHCGYYAEANIKIEYRGPGVSPCKTVDDIFMNKFKFSGIEHHESENDNTFTMYIDELLIYSITNDLALTIRAAIYSLARLYFYVDVYYDISAYMGKRYPASECDAQSRKKASAFIELYDKDITYLLDTGSLPS